MLKNMFVGLICAGIIAGCDETTSGTAGVTPRATASATAPTQDTPTRNSSYYLRHQYVGEALAFGNAAMAATVAGQGAAARQNFVQSTDTLAAGLAQHRQYARARADQQQTAATILTVGIGLAGMNAANRASKNAASTADLNRINAAFGDFIDATGNFGQFLNEQIRLGEIGSSAVQRVDRDRWRSVVVSDHPNARSLVQIVNETRGTNCSGFFIDRYVVMTAAHCFRIGDALAAFREQPQNGQDYMTGTRQFLEIDRQFAHIRWDGDIKSSAFDIAFLLMAQPSPVWLPVSTAPVARGQQLMAFGYSGDLNNGYFLQVDYGCTVNSISADDGLGSNCVLWRGNSGGPIMTAGPNPRVVGVNSSSYLRRDRSANDGFAASTRQAIAMYDSLLQSPSVRGRATRNPFR